MEKEERGKRKGVLQETIYEAVKSRLPILLVLLMLQSAASLILERFEAFLDNHFVIEAFLTLLLGAGGNSGGQSAATILQVSSVGHLPLSEGSKYLIREGVIGIALGIFIAVIGFFRCWMNFPIFDSLVVGAVLFVVVPVSTIVGTAIPLIAIFFYNYLGRSFDRGTADAFHPATTTFPILQVAMDIIGVIILITVASFLYTLGQMYND